MRNDAHLSDEAVAACADGVLSGAAQDRATRHIASCAECARAVKVQREAVWALRAAPPPPLPGGLFQRLREVPQTTPIRTLPTAIGPDGSTVLASLAPAAAFAPAKGGRSAHRVRGVALASAAVALAGAVAAASAAQSGSGTDRPGSGRLARPGSTHSAGKVRPVGVFHQLAP